MSNSMACAICCASLTSTNTALSVHKNLIFNHVKCIPQLGHTNLSHWNGLKRLGISVVRYSGKIEMKRKLRNRQGVFASLFGVGAPEALVIGVVALLVFGPKGLAEVARNLGKTLRAFQPTIRELQEVSREFKNTLEREIGLDEPEYQRPNSTSSNATNSTTEDSTEFLGSDIESNGSPESLEDSGQDNASKLRGVLDQLQKEQAEEEKRGTQDTPNVLDASPETFSETTNNPSSDGNDLEEVSTSASSTSSSSYNENF